MSKVVVIPCSGIGKVMGLLSRETALEVTNRLAPEITETACLGQLVTGDEDARVKITGRPCITIDGCTANCAIESVTAIGGNIQAKYQVLDEMRKHRGKNAGDGSMLTVEGWQIVDEFAAHIAKRAEELHKEGRTNG
ncbi:MAG: putative zinc-binding protein [Symbiobacteriaceae bacterium]|nr:putative zinc-binding protein [Symbiobacteriaceae bacterium]